MIDDINTNVNFTRDKNEDDITTQALRLMVQVTDRCKFDALLNPMTPQELRIAKAYQSELKAHHDYCDLTKRSKHSRSWMGDRMQRKQAYYSPAPDGYYLVRCYVGGKEIETPFGNKVYRPYSLDQNERMKEYCVGICMGMYCKYKHPSVEIVWRNFGVEKIIAAFNR